MRDADLPSSPAHEPTWWQRITLVIPSSVLLVIGVIGLGFAPHEDAYIVFRYAITWAGWGELRPYVGALPIEGYSDLTWVAVLALSARLGFELPTTAVAIGCVLAIVNLVLLDYLAQRAGRKLLARCVLQLLVASNLSFIRLTANGLETMAYCALLLGWIAALPTRRAASWREQSFAGGIAALLALTRPEAPLLLLCWAVLRQWSGWREPWLWTVASLAIGGQIIWRLQEFGLAWPAAFYVKMIFLGGGSDRLWVALSYLLRFSCAQPVTTAWIVIGVLSRWREQDFDARALWCLILASVAFICIAGGDMPTFLYFRFLLPAMLAGWLLVLPWLERRGPRTLLLALALSQLNGYFPTIADLEHNRPRYLWFLAPRLSDLWPGRGSASVDLNLATGQWLAHELASQPSRAIAGRAAGKLPWAAGPRRTFVDLLGLTSAETMPRSRDVEAHQHQVAKTLASYRPWVISEGSNFDADVALLAPLGYRIRGAIFRADQAMWPLALLAAEQPWWLLIPAEDARQTDAPLEWAHTPLLELFAMLGRTRLIFIDAVGQRTHTRVAEQRPATSMNFDAVNTVVAGNLAPASNSSMLLDTGQFPAVGRFRLEGPTGPCRLWLRLRSADARRLRISIAGQLLNELEIMTGSYEPAGAIWLAVGEWQQRAGAVDLELTSPSFFPYLEALALEPLP